MIGSDPFVAVFGGAPAHTRAHPVEHVRAVIRAGFSPVLCLPDTSMAPCPLSPTMAKRAGNHPCGNNHVHNDPARIGAVVKRFIDTHGGLNVALHLGRSRLAVFQQLGVMPGMTVIAGNDGHWWFTLPDGVHVQPMTRSTEPRWTLLAGDMHVLVPPSRHGVSDEYRLVGGTMPAPQWLVTG